MILHERETAQFRKQVEDLLSETYRTPVSLKRPRFMPSRPNVCRFVVQRGPAVLGNSLVVKRLRTVETDTALATRYPSSRYMFFNDWAGLQFLTQEAGESPIGPRLYAADREMELVVMEDIRPESDGGSCLQGKDPRMAEEKLLLLARALGMLHARTIGKQATFNRIRDAIAPRHPSWGWVPPWQRTLSMYEKLLQTLPVNIKQSGFESFRWMSFTLHQATEALSLPIPAQAEIELERVMQALRSPGPLLAYTHGDPCPENCLFSGNVARLVDFENGDYRHALLDAVYARMCFPTCWNAQQLPHQSVIRVERAYQAELVKGCPEVADEQCFTRELVHACAYWVLMLCQFNAISHFSTEDQSWGPFTMRQRMLTRFERFAQTTVEYGYLEALGLLFHTIASELRKRWPAAMQRLPTYPAFKRLSIHADTGGESLPKR